MRPTVIFPLLCTIIALILAFLAVFAGTNHDQMERYDLLVLNTSRIGYDFFNASKTTSASPAAQTTGGNWFTTLIHNATSEVKNITHNLENDIENDLQKAFASLAKDLGLRDFYSVHVLNYCEGYFSPNGTSNRNVTYCSNQTSNFTFDPTQTLQAQLNASHVNITLDQLHWPSAITQGIDDLKLAFNVTFVLYCIGIAFTGLALFGTLVGLFFNGRITALLNVGLSWLAFLTLMIASAIVTYATNKAVNVINKYGQDVNVNAARGNNFIALTWAATILVAIAGISWIGECIVGRRHQKMTPKQMQ